MGSRFCPTVNVSLENKILDRGFRVGDVVKLHSPIDGNEGQTFLVCERYANYHDLDESEALEPENGLATGALAYDLYDVDSDETIDIVYCEYDHNEVELVRKADDETTSRVEHIQESLSA